MKKSKLGKRLNSNSGQSTTELAVFGLVLLVALGSLLRYGQMMNKQQQMRMHAFRGALNKAYHGYGAGGLGGASYTAIKNIHIATPFRDYYDGSQRAAVTGGATVLWDPDLMYADGDRPNSYVEVDGIEKNLGANAREEIVTDSVVQVNQVEESYNATGSTLTNSVRARTDEYLVTTVKMEEGDDIVFEQANTFAKDESWTTPWE